MQKSLFRGWIHRIALVIMMSAVSPWASAVSCTETVTAIVLHTNGNVYFTTSQTCTTAWCQIAFSTTDGNKQAYAMLLEAQALSKPLTFEWDNISACTSANAVYASPTVMVMGQ
jgi:hypothetical protein